MTSPVARPAKRPRRPGIPAATPTKRPPGKAANAQRHFAIIGAGMAGVVCARTLVQAGHQVTVFEKSSQAGGRTTTIDSPFGSFDAGAQYFTVRDPRFAQAIATVPGVCRPWSANAVRVLDAAGRVAAAGLPTHEPHWVASTGMNALVATWATPLRRAGLLQGRGPGGDEEGGIAVRAGHPVRFVGGKRRNAACRVEHAHGVGAPGARRAQWLWLEQSAGRALRTANGESMVVVRPPAWEDFSRR